MTVVDRGVELRLEGERVLKGRLEADGNLNLVDDLKEVLGVLRQGEQELQEHAVEGCPDVHGQDRNGLVARGCEGEQGQHGVRGHVRAARRDAAAHGVNEEGGQEPT